MHQPTSPLAARRGRRLLALASLCVALALPRPASAQPSDADLGDKASFFILFPQLRNLAAPVFLQPGVRVSYTSGSATGGGGPAGGGVIQYDVVARDGRQVLVQQTSYGDLGSGVFPMGSTAARGYPGLGPFWLNPAVLANAEAVASANLAVTRYAKALPSGQTVTVVRFQTETTNGRLVTEFDTATGVMVFDSFSAGPSAGQVVLAGVRQLQLPWASSRAPNWVRPGAALAYSGVKRTVISGGGAVDQQQDYAMVLREAGARWSLAEVTARLAGAEQGRVVLATGEGQLLGALWLPVSALTVPLSAQGVRLDVDPVTGAELYLAQAEGGGILLQEVTQAARTTAIYHPTLGVLDRSILETAQQVSAETTDVARVTPNATLETLAQQAPLPEDPSTAGAAGGSGGGGGCASGGSPEGSWAWLLLVLAAVATLAPRRRRSPARQS